jgi:hypothetical protein
VPDANIDEGGELDGSFLGVLRAWVIPGKELPGNDPVEAGEGNWWSGHGDGSI